MTLTNSSLCTVIQNKFLLTSLSRDCVVFIFFLYSKVSGFGKRGDVMLFLPAVCSVKSYGSMHFVRFYGQGEDKIHVLMKTVLLNEEVIKVNIYLTL